MLQTLRKVDGSLVLTVPEPFIDQNGLIEGSSVDVHFEGNKMTVEVPIRHRYKLVDLMAEMPGGLPRVDGWEYPNIDRWTCLWRSDKEDVVKDTPKSNAVQSFGRTSKTSVGEAGEALSNTGPARRKLSLSDLNSTVPRTAEEVRRLIAQGRFAELKPEQA
jgi:antitoxin ChpS